MYVYVRMYECVCMYTYVCVCMLVYACIVCVGVGMPLFFPSGEASG